MKSNKRLTLVEMERRLLEDESGKFRKEILEKLSKYQQQIKSQTTKGLPPEKFKIFDQLKVSLDAAYDVIMKFK